MKTQILVALLTLSVVTMAAAQGSDQPATTTPVAQSADADMAADKAKLKEARKEVRETRKELHEKRKIKRAHRKEMKKHRMEKRHDKHHSEQPAGTNPDGTMGEGP